ncbi:unnamed protein product [Arabis nemorensis]|uniref:Uncharacterized protein n=1 Tax=Arabis nemorensis TaxID=586526 RepID=A0A565B9V2_9BRAS|nr:unnamed protein product [Arabis nemorensis]
MVTTRKTKARVTTASHRRPPPEPEFPVKKFFQLVLPSATKRNMMRIPTRFVKLHGSNLSEFATLETPMGFKRSIKLKRIGEEIWKLEFTFNNLPLDAVHISDNDEIIDLTDEGFLGAQGTRENNQSVNVGDSEHKLKKSPRDIEFENILNGKKPKQSDFVLDNNVTRMKMRI